MATIKELLSAIIDKINGNEDKIDNIKGVPEAFDSITMTNGTDTANLTMNAEKELLFNGNPVSGGSGGGNVVVFDINTDENDEYIVTCNKSVDEVCQLVVSRNAVFYFRAFHGSSYNVDTYLTSLCPNISESFANGQLLGVVFMINDFEMAHNAVNIELSATPGGENFTIDVN